MANTELKTLIDESKVKAIKAVLEEREVFPNYAAAMDKLNTAALVTLEGLPADSAPFFGLPVAIKGAKDDGTIDESIYEGRSAVLAFVGAKIAGKGTEKGTTGIKGIVILPMPTVEEFLSSDNGKGFIARTVEKECALVAFRRFRDAATSYEFESGVQSVPVTAEEFTTAVSRGLDTSTFDKVWKPFRDALKEKSEAIWKLLPLKNEFRDAMRSKAFAESNDKTVAFERQGLIVALGNALIQTAKTWQDEKGQPAPLDTTVMEGWLAGRDEFVIERETEEKDYSILDSIKLDF